MTARVVKFSDVGREHRTFDVAWDDIPRDDVDSDGLPSCDWVAMQAKRHGGLRSDDVGASPVENDPRDLRIYAGFRTVGRARIEGDVFGLRPGEVTP